MADLQPVELLHPVGLIFVADIGEDDNVCLPTDLAQRVERAVDQMLAMHLRVEEAAEQLPGAFRRDRHAFPVGQRADEARPAELEAIAISLGDIIGEVRREMEKHVVAVADQQRPAHSSSSCRAATRRSGVTPSASAQASRSGS